MKDYFRPAVAEFVGTFMLVFIGAGSIVIDSYTRGGFGLLGIALAQGLALAVMVSTFGAISGGHFNPAISLGIRLAKKIGSFTLILYVLAQLAGGLCAAFALRSLFPVTAWDPAHIGAPVLALGLTPLAGLGLEFILTVFLMLSYLGTTVDAMAPKIGGLGVGMAVAASVIIGGPLTGAALNPARVLGCAIASGYWFNHWIYWAGPLAGATVASFLYTRILSRTI